MSDDINQARDTLSQLSVFRDHDLKAVKITRLGGLTNLVYRVQNNHLDYCLRIPGAGTEEYIDREVEAHAATMAAKSGVSPDVIYADAKSGIMVTRFLKGADTMTADTFRSISGSVGRAGEAFAMLHN